MKNVIKSLIVLSIILTSCTSNVSRLDQLESRCDSLEAIVVILTDNQLEAAKIQKKASEMQLNLSKNQNDIANQNLKQSEYINRILKILTN